MQSLLAHLFIRTKIQPCKGYNLESVTATAGVMFILAGAQAFSSYLTWERIPMIISEAIIANISSAGVFLLVVNALLLLIGCFFDGGAAMILLAPLLVPAAEAMGIDLIHFGVVMCVNLTIAGFLLHLEVHVLYRNCRLQD